MDIVMSVTLYSVVIFLLSSILGNSRALAFGFTKTHALVHVVDQAGKKYRTTNQLEECLTLCFLLMCALASDKRTKLSCVFAFVQV